MIDIPHPRTAPHPRTDHRTDRPTMRAEDLTMSGRLALLAAAVVPSLVATAAAIAAFVWPDGLFHLGLLGATLPFLAVGVAFLALVAHGALLEANADLDENARRLWTAAFVLAPALAMPAYWWAHVRPARLA